MLYITVLLFFLEELRIHLIIRVQLKLLLLLFIPVAVTTAGMTFLSSTLHFVQWLPTPTKNKIGNLTRDLLIYVYGKKLHCVYFINLILSVNSLKCLAQGIFLHRGFYCDISAAVKNDTVVKRRNVRSSCLTTAVLLFIMLKARLNRNSLRYKVKLVYY